MSDLSHTRHSGSPAGSAIDHYKSFFENAVEGIYQTTVDGRYIRVNRTLARLYGYASPDVLINDLTDIAGQLYCDPSAREAFADAMARYGVIHNFEARIFRRDGAIIWILENARCVRDESGVIQYYEGTVQDITERKLQESRIRQLATVFDSVAEGILIVSPELMVQAVNPAFTAMTNRPASDVVGKPLNLFPDGAHEQRYIDAIWGSARQSGRWQGEITALRGGGEAFAAAISVSSVRAPSGQIEHYVLTLSDISQRKYQEHQIRYQSSFDRLTDLPNRWLVYERLEEAILRAQRSGTRVAVLFVDLNRFKQINETFGHSGGDQLLKLVSKRLRATTRVSDTVGRLGGDEFLIVAPGAVDRDAAALVAEKILYSMDEAYQIGGREVYCGSCIGIAMYPDDGETPEQLLRNAELAMTTARRTKGGFLSFEPGMRLSGAAPINLEADLRRALAKDQFELYFQPKFDMVERRILGVEALIRWHHPTRGLVFPADFIPLAEETGLIWEIGAWTLATAVRILAKWIEQAVPVGIVSVNLSARQLQDPRLVPMVAQIIEQAGVPPGRIELELTESAMIGDIEKAVDVVRSLKSVGVKVAIDDFGIGYSSLSYLKRFPVDTLKIDRSFVRDIASSEADPAIVGTIVNLADALGFATIAEGVETQDQAELLCRQGCAHIQGFLISPPLPQAALEAFVRDSSGGRLVRPIGSS